MTMDIDTDVCVIGAGSGGLSVAAGASQMGARTVLIERGRMGGDCLNFGCVPSKALLAAGRVVALARAGGRFGIGGLAPQVEFDKVHDHVHGTINAIAPNDSVARFEALGVHVIRASARFTGHREVEANGTRVRAKWFVLATGSSPATPPIPGLDEISYLTNETLFERTAAPDHLIVVGGGPVGIEMAQAHRRLGARVTVLEMATILPHDDPEAVDVVRCQLVAEGIDIREGVKVVRLARSGNGIAATVEQGGEEVVIEGSDLLLATGRSANVDGLGLEAAGIEYTSRGVRTDHRLRTTNRRAFAVGDVADRLQFTHVAGYHAGIVIRNMLFRLPARVNDAATPWVTYTDPELAHVGLSEVKAREGAGEIRVLRWPFAENDRAQAERRTDGFVKVVTTARGRVLGATVVGPHAGELILPWVLAIDNGLGIGRMARVIAPYPTLGEASKRAAGCFYVPKLFGSGTRRVVRFLMKLA